MNMRLLSGSLALLAWMIQPAAALEGDPYAHETREQKDARMAWWREAKFGLFIHWGVYAVPAGTYDNRKIDGIGEWIMQRAKIPVEQYKAYAKDFNPVKYQPEAWADLAKEAGMRYMVITSKHHDGFTLFPSEVSNWSITGATPWKSDLIAPLAAAARSRGIKFGLYYSQAQDWTHPGGAKSGYQEGDGWDDAHKGSFDPYLDGICVPQVREILTRYQPDVLWWDTPHLMTRERAAKLASLLALRPGIIHNNRLGGGYQGDTETPEQYIPSRGFPGRDWETCMTLNDTWGFKSDDLNWKPLSTIIRNLVDIASKGGNYLLNVGPTREGEIPAESVRLLKEVGAWMRVNGESIYGSQSSPFPRLPWGRCTSKPDGSNTRLYLHVLDWPAEGKLLVPGLVNKVLSVETLAGNMRLEVTPTPGGPVVQLPTSSPDPVCPTLRMIIEGSPQVVETPVTADKDGVIQLLPLDARYEGEVKSEENHGHANIGYWTNSKDSVSWKVKADHEGKYLVRIDAAAPAEGSVLQIQGVGKLAYSVPCTGSYDTFKTTKVGEVSLQKDVEFELSLRPVADGWKAVNIRKVELVPQP